MTKTLSFTILLVAGVVNISFAQDSEDPRKKTTNQRERTGTVVQTGPRTAKGPGGNVSQDSTTTKKNTGAEITGERKKDPNAEGTVTGERTRKPVSRKERKVKD